MRALSESIEKLGGKCVNCRGKSPNPYRAQITPIGGKRTALGYYATAEEASAVFEKARKEQIKILIETETDLKVKNAMLNLNETSHP